MKPSKRQLANRAKWIAALRSGDYQQGEHALCRNNKFCCLGVDAKLARQLTRKVQERHYSGAEITQRLFKFNQHHGLVPHEWFAKRHGITLLQAGELTSEAIGWNDSLQYSFKRIAREVRIRFARFDKENAKL